MRCLCAQVLVFELCVFWVWPFLILPPWSVWFQHFPACKVFTQFVRACLYKSHYIISLSLLHAFLVSCYAVIILSNLLLTTVTMHSLLFVCLPLRLRQ